MRVIYRKIRHARYLYIKTNVEKVWGARYTLGARYLSKNTVINLHYGQVLKTLQAMDIFLLYQNNKCWYGK